MLNYKTDTIDNAHHLIKYWNDNCKCFPLTRSHIRCFFFVHVIYVNWFDSSCLAVRSYRFSVSIFVYIFFSAFLLILLLLRLFLFRFYRFFFLYVMIMLHWSITEVASTWIECEHKIKSRMELIDSYWTWSVYIVKKENKQTNRSQQIESHHKLNQCVWFIYFRFSTSSSSSSSVRLRFRVVSQIFCQKLSAKHIYIYIYRFGIMIFWYVSYFHSKAQTVVCMESFEVSITCYWFLMWPSIKREEDTHSPTEEESKKKNTHRMYMGKSKLRWYQESSYHPGAKAFEWT